MKEKSSVQAHINMMQGLINRMASNSANCKLWCVTIITASLALFFDGKLNQLQCCYLVILAFYFLDCFYLGLERQFINAQNRFVNLINEGANHAEIEKQIFIPYTIKESKTEDCRFKKKLNHIATQLWQMVKAMVSLSTTPFYGLLFLAVYYLVK